MSYILFYSFRSFLATQVQDKEKMKEWEKDKNKWFIDNEMKEAEKAIQDEQGKQKIKRLKELQNNQFVVDQIGISSTCKS